MAGQIEVRDVDLARPMRRVAASMALNTTDGVATMGSHNRQRYQLALGSVREVIAYIDVANALR